MVPTQLQRGGASCTSEGLLSGGDRQVNAGNVTALTRGCWQVKIFLKHCVYVRSIYLFAKRPFRDSNEEERKLMDSLIFFDNHCKVFTEFIIVSACRMTDRTNAGDFTAEMFVNGFASEPATFDKLSELHDRMQLFKGKIVDA